MFIICHLQNKKPIDGIVSDFFLRKKNKRTMQFQRQNLRVRFKISKSFDCKPKIFRKLNLRKMNQLIMKKNRETVADIVIFPAAQIGKCLK